MDKNWQNDPRLADMDKSKLEMLQNLAEQGTGKNASDMLPFLMDAASRGKGNGLNFPLMKSPLFWKFSKWENPLRKLQKLTAL